MNADRICPMGKSVKALMHFLRLRHSTSQDVSLSERSTELTSFDKEK